MYVRGEGRFPNLEAWFEAMEKRPAYLGSRSDFYTHCHDLPPQLGGQHLPLVHQMVLFLLASWLPCNHASNTGKHTHGMAWPAEASE